jgi:hypothetical protein
MTCVFLFDLCFKAYIYVVSKNSGVANNQEDFIIDWICSMNHRDEFMEQQKIQSDVAAFASQIGFPTHPQFPDK